MTRLSFGLVWLSAVVFALPVPAAEVVSLRLNDTVIRAEVAGDRKTRVKGLGNRDRLEQGWGMLFKFAVPKKYPFYMKGMRFPIDIVWIYDGEVAGVTASVPPPLKATDKLPLYYPPVPVDMVLEINSGKAGKIKLKKGDKIIFLKERKRRGIK